MVHKRTSKSRRRGTGRETELADEGSGAERLQKVLAAAGLGSRRDCETLITEGRVEVDRVMITELGSKVDPLTQDIRVDGVALHKPKKLYFALNKPSGVLCTNFDPSHRTRVIDLIPTEERVFPVGRLDSGSEGLIIVTNDGELANRVTHPRYGLDKTYFVRVAGQPSDEELLQLRRGIRLSDGFARVVGLKVKKRYSSHTDMELVLNEGKNREIRRILAKVGHKVMLLRRTAVGPVKLGELPLGMSRKLLPKEVEMLLEATHRRREAKPTHESEDEVIVETTPAITKPRAVKPREPKPPMDEVATKTATKTSTKTSAPPKIDLATLLNPQSAPKAATIVTPLPAPPSAAGPSVGDVLNYEEDAESSIPGNIPTYKAKKPKRGLEEKLALEREANPDFMLTQQAAEKKDHVIRPRDKGKKKFDASKLPPGRRTEARQASRPGSSRSGSTRPTSSRTTSTRPAARSAGKPAGKPAGKSAGRKVGGRSNQGANPRSGEQRGSQSRGSQARGSQQRPTKNQRRGK